MSSISQTVPNYVLGMSEQPDQLKTLGQVRDLVNGLPDVTRMLSKRPGTAHIRELIGPNQNRGHWFSMYRDDREQYIARILPALNQGTLNVWRLVDGPLNIYPGSLNTTTTAYVNVISFGTGYTANSIGANIPVTPVGPATGTDLTVSYKVDATGRMQAATIHTLGTNWNSGDTGTFNVGGIVSTIKYFEGIAGEECHVNLDNASVTPYSVLTNTNNQITPKASVAALDYLRGPVTDPTDGSRFKTLTINDTTLIVNQTITTAMSGVAGDIEPDYAREGFVSLEQIAFGQTYSFAITLNTGVSYPIIGTQTSNTAATGASILTDLKARVDVLTNGSLPNNPLLFTTSIVGDGLYIQPGPGFPQNAQNTVDFSLQTAERQLLSVFTNEVQDLTVLPDQCANGYRVKVINSGLTEDDYYLKFEGANGISGQGVWVEHRGPNVPFKIDSATMPHTLVRMSDLSFTLSRGDYSDRLVGDTTNNPNPSFIGHPINNVCLFRNRLGFLSRQNVILSRPSDFFNFFISTALTVTPKDPIDLSASSTQPATLWDSIEVNAGLMLFSRSEQFMMTTDNDILSAETAKINFVSAYNYNPEVSPFTLGTTLGFINDETANSRLYEMASPQREGEPQVIEQSKIISTLYPTGINRISSSKNNAVVLTGKPTDNTLWGYRYFNSTERRLQSAWFKFTLNDNIIYHTIIKDVWYGVLSNSAGNLVTFQSMDLKDTDFVYNYKDVDYRAVVRLDNAVEISYNKIVYNPATNSTTVDLNTVGWNETNWTYDPSKISGTKTGLKCFQIGSGIDEQCVDVLTNNQAHANRLDATFTQLTLDGNWKDQTGITISSNDAQGFPDKVFISEPVQNNASSGSGMRLSGEVKDNKIVNVVISNPGTGYVDGDTVRLVNYPNSLFTISKKELTIWIGYEYEMDVEFPKIYPIKSNGQSSSTDVNGSLVLHRCKFNMFKVGTYEFELNRLGRETFSYDQETRYADSYDANDAPIINTDQVTIPIYDRNMNTDIHLKSEYPLPVTLISMTWEGEYTNLSYKRS